MGITSAYLRVCFLLGIRSFDPSRRQNHFFLQFFNFFLAATDHEAEQKKQTY